MEKVMNHHRDLYLFPVSRRGRALREVLHRPRITAAPVRPETITVGNVTIEVERREGE